MSSNAKKYEIQLVTGSLHTLDSLSTQLHRYFGREFLIHPYVIDDDSTHRLRECFTLFSSMEVYVLFTSLNPTWQPHDYLIAERSIVYEKLNKILLLPRDEDILLVNDSEESANEVINYLIHMGFDFLRLVPYYPGCSKDISGIKIAITPGEMDKTPGSINSVYDIGVRVMEFSTIARLLNYFGMLDEKVNECYEAYTQSLMYFAKQVSNVAYEANSIISTVRPGLIGRGYYAKYHFDDIIGASKSIKEVREVANKIARTNLSLLIEGDNGTGKELFASAIHNASSRIKRPFVAVNISALPDELIESELFGYEEGAFTGARKGGKTGIFEQANGGTVFLDEIGDISPKMQSKLLRVLQEKEILRVGGNRIITVDVRIIAATNRDLQEMIREGKFRKDLYYRLRESYLRIPSLDERVEDIPLLVNHFLQQPGKQYGITPKALSLLIKKDWPGNVRELQNAVKYAAAVSSSMLITEADLPYDTRSTEIRYEPDRVSEGSDIDIGILRATQSLSKKGKVAGRTKILAWLESAGIQVSEYQLRIRLNELLDEGLLSKSNGRYGYALSLKGQEEIALKSKP